MASEIIVQTIKAPTSGANANKVIIPSGVTLDASAGTLKPSAGALVKVDTVRSTTEVQVTTGGYVTIFDGNFTPLYNNSIIYIDLCTNVGQRSSGEVQFNHRLQRNSSTDVTTHFNTTHSSNFDVFRKPDASGAALHFPISLYFLDQPNTTSSTNYRFQVVTPNTSYPTMYFNFAGRSSSHMRFMEIAQ